MIEILQVKASAWVFFKSSSGLPKCIAKAIWYRLNQGGATQFETVFETHGAPIKSRAESVVYQILQEKYTQKQFDQITQYSMPNFVWEVCPPDVILKPDFIAKGPVTTMQEYLDTGRGRNPLHFNPLDEEPPGAADCFGIKIDSSCKGPL